MYRRLSKAEALIKLMVTVMFAGSIALPDHAPLSNPHCRSEVDVAGVHAEGNDRAL